ncbi:hypothetical protein [Erythrobacter sp. JK5]|uniref:hypothetical protein n=1 Tax=Erythrobacter sp. JK5 TaxID=2829500 RepID=UPI001BA558D4|nr:hypothetical protein [Erythrobacter sp. JK5]QUL36678.1 hypothetical protein KDC96_09580 [Erythrobacter sp. JK5]
MKVELKTWAGLGLATALAGAGLAGCAGEGGESGETAQTSQSGEAGEAGEGEGGEGEGGAIGTEVAALSLPQRVAFMSGHAAAGIALYRAGESEAAAPHLLHPVSETHADERAGLAQLGFDPAPFEQVSAALEARKPAAQIEPQLKAAEANLAKVRAAAGGDPAEQIRFLMDVAFEEYAVAVPEGSVADPGEYQDAWGFVKVAREIAEDLDAPKAAQIRKTLDTLLALWPKDAPIPPEKPAAKGQVSALTARVLLDLPPT